MRNLEIVPKSNQFLPQLGVLTNVVELAYYDMLYIHHLLQNRMELTLQRELNPVFDKNAIEVYFQGRKIGYISNKVNGIIARHMDAGKYVYAKIKQIKRNRKMPLSDLEIEVIVM